MRHFAYAWLWLMAGLACAQGEAIDAAEEASLRAVIEAQLAAFAQDEAEQAFAFASHSIREKFGSARNFIAMVRAHYPVVMRPTTVLFLKPERAPGEILQAVQMTDTDGQLWLALYRMQAQADGSWRINGCVLRPVDGQRT